jgi:hypothetical protein
VVTPVSGTTLGLTLGMHPIADDLTIYDSIIVGDGPEALNTALMLGRSHDRVLLLDDDQGEGTTSDVSDELERRRVFEALRPYDVTVQACHVMRIDRHLPDLLAASSKNRTWFGRKVWIATGRDMPCIIARLGADVRCRPVRGGWEASIGE